MPFHVHTDSCTHGETIWHTLIEYQHTTGYQTGSNSLLGAFSHTSTISVHVLGPYALRGFGLTDFQTKAPSMLLLSAVIFAYAGVVVSSTSCDSRTFRAYIHMCACVHIYIYICTHMSHTYARLTHSARTRPHTHIHPHPHDADICKPQTQTHKHDSCNMLCVCMHAQTYLH
jgi:hypothetical protein